MSRETRARGSEAEDFPTVCPAIRAQFAFSSLSDAVQSARSAGGGRARDGGERRQRKPRRQRLDHLPQALKADRPGSPRGGERDVAKTARQVKFCTCYGGPPGACFAV
jgi:hypothetical protein